MKKIILSPNDPIPSNLKGINDYVLSHLKEVAPNTSIYKTIHDGYETAILLEMGVLPQRAARHIGNNPDSKVDFLKEIESMKTLE